MKIAMLKHTKEEIQKILDKDELNLRQSSIKAYNLGYTKDKYRFFDRMRYISPNAFLEILQQDGCRLIDRYKKYLKKKNKLYSDCYSLSLQLGPGKTAKLLKQYNLKGSFLFKTKGVKTTKKSIKDLKAIKEVLSMYVQ
jgi:hypothetical protein